MTEVHEHWLDHVHGHDELVRLEALPMICHPDSEEPVPDKLFAEKLGIDLSDLQEAPHGGQDP
jgi:hypothetical protein